MSDDRKLLDRINAVPISADECLDLAAASEEYHRQHPDANDEDMVGLYLISQQFRMRRNPDKVFALWSRMYALSKLLKEQGAPGWAFPSGKGDGCFHTQEAVFAATAVHPMVEAGNEWVFEYATFLDCVLDLAETETPG